MWIKGRKKKKSPTLNNFGGGRSNFKISNLSHFCHETYSHKKCLCISGLTMIMPETLRLELFKVQTGQSLAG